MKDGVAVLGVAGAGDFAELLRDLVPLAEDYAGEGFVVQLLVEREVSGQEAVIEGRKGEFEVVGVEAVTFFDRACGWAGAEADIPHGLNDGADGRAGRFFRVVVGKGEEHIDVGEREEIFAAISAKGEHGRLDGNIGAAGAESPPPELNQHAVDHRGAPADGSRAVTGAVVGLADERHLLLRGMYRVCSLKKCRQV
jgi:hypothetical protein